MTVFLVVCASVVGYVAISIVAGLILSIMKFSDDLEDWQEAKEKCDKKGDHYCTLKPRPEPDLRVIGWGFLWPGLLTIVPALLIANAFLDCANKIVEKIGGDLAEVNMEEKRDKE